MTNRPKSIVHDPFLDQEREYIIPPPEMRGPEGGLLESLLHLVEWKGFILKVVLSVTILSTIAVMIWPKSYTATVRLMPPEEAHSSLASALSGQLGEMASIASAMSGAAVSLGKPGSDVYLYILRSRTVADDLIKQFSLARVYHDKEPADTRDDLKDNTEISAGKEGGISISVTDHDRQRAADIANAYVDELKKLTKTLAVTAAGRRRIFFGREVQLASEELSKAELAMKQTQEQTGIVMLEPQSRAMIEGLAGLQAQVAVKEAEVESMRTFATDDNPDLKRAEGELSAIKAELSRLQSGKVGPTVADMDMRKVPEKALQYLRAVRELKYREAVYEAMTKEYEIARVDEAKDSSIIQVLDKALPPEKRSSPKRTLVVAIASALAFLLAVGFASFAERTKQDQLLLSRLRMLGRSLLARSKS